MEDVLRRLGNVEASVVDVRTQVSGIAERMLSLATAQSVSDLRTEMKESISQLRVEFTKDMSGLRSELTASIAEVRSDHTKDISGVKSELSELKSEVSRISGTIDSLATAASVASLETRMIKWFIGTSLTLTALVFSIAKLVH